MERHVLKGRWGNVEYLFYVYDAKRKSQKIFSVSFFIIKDSNKLNQYKKGLKELIDRVGEIMPEYNVRIYYDVTAANFVKQFLNKDNVELYLYYFPKFFDKDKMVHYGHFGTLIRYLPLFDIKDHSNRETIIFDIDNYLGGNALRVVKYFDNSEERLIYRSRFCYLDDRIIKIGMRQLHPIISSLVCQRGILPSQIFINFLNQCLLETCIRYRKFIEDVHKKYDIMTKYIYGIDEYFINYDYINYYVDNNIEYSYTIFVTDTIKGIKLWMKYLKDNNISSNDKIDSLIMELSRLFKTDKDKLSNMFDKYYSSQYYNKQVINIVKKYKPEEIKMPKIYYDCIIRNEIIKGGKILLITVKNNREHIKML